MTEAGGGSIVYVSSMSGIKGLWTKARIAPRNTVWKAS